MSKILTYLPETITEKGTTFKRFNGFDFRDKNGNVFLPRTDEEFKKALKSYCKEHKSKYRSVKVLAKNLRGRLDLHNKPYEPLLYTFIEVK